MSKKIDIKLPNQKNEKAKKDWIQGKEKEAKAEPKSTAKNKRLTIDIPEDLHNKFKIDCIKKGLNMAEVIKRLIQENCKDN